MKNNILFSTIILVITLSLFACEDDSPSLDPCQNITCLNDGECNNGQCDCPTGYEGMYCETEISTDPCQNINCQNDGYCVDGSCICPSGYEGYRCQTMTQPDSITVHRVKVDYWYYNLYLNQGSRVEIQYFIDNVLYHHFMDLDVDMDLSNQTHDFIPPVGLKMPSDQVTTFRLTKIDGNIIGETVHNPIVDGDLQFLPENNNTGIYSLRVSNQQSGSGTVNGEFRFILYCTLHWD